MKWIGITGSWRATSKEVETHVRSTVRAIINNDDGIVTGGALNVDYFATDEALKLNPRATQIKVFLPVTLELYAKHYKKRAVEGIITTQQSEDLIKQLTNLKQANPNALIEDKGNTSLTKETYYGRNTNIVDNSDEIYAFQVNDSKGTQDTIDKTRKQGKKVRIKKYEIS